MNTENRIKMGLRILFIATPLLACCCPAMPIAHMQSDEIIHVSSHRQENTALKHSGESAAKTNNAEQSAPVLHIHKAQNATQNLPSLHKNKTP